MTLSSKELVKEYIQHYQLGRKFFRAISCVKGIATQDVLKWMKNNADWNTSAAAATTATTAIAASSHDNHHPRAGPRGDYHYQDKQQHHHQHQQQPHRNLLHRLLLRSSSSNSSPDEHRLDTHTSASTPDQEPPPPSQPPSQQVAPTRRWFFRRRFFAPASSSAAAEDRHRLLLQHHHHHGGDSKHADGLLEPEQRPVRPDRPSLLLRSEMPHWYHHTPFILTGYRAIQHSFRGCVHSLTYVHNETGNILTHALGFVVFLVLFRFAELEVAELGPAASAATAEEGAWRLDALFLALFHWSALYCMTASTLFHLFCCHSQSVSRSCIKADYLGIVVLILSSLLPIVHYGHYCQPARRTVYTAMMLSLGAVTCYVALAERFRGADYRALRTTLFVALGLSGSLPVLDGLLTVPNFSALIHLPRLTHGAVYFLSGAAVFMFHVPERWLPGAFDYIGQSHQLFHVAIVVGSVLQRGAVLGAIRTWHERVAAASAAGGGGGGDGGVCG
ncbi:hemolysin-III related-domain-containing protein [Zopfochytrium polystomum]|nr:hemolysin-III related-domain-containing protein [Zopfochytrium polystomum]